jgi:hypothetical protein
LTELDNHGGWSDIPASRFSMPSISEHCKEAQATFGKPYTQVHEWLDACHDLPGYGGVAHRRKRHHMEGLAYIRQTWGDEAANVARQHIMSDLKQIGWTGEFPQNERHCEQLGLWITR